MKKFIIYLSVVILITIVIGSFFYAYFLRLDSDFWKSMVGNLLATLIGLAAGVPVGLWINRFIESTQAEKRKADERKKEIDILNLIKEEIEFCLNNIFLCSAKNRYNSYIATPYRTEMWDAFGASSEIKYISSSQLLAQIAHAYHYIKAENRLEYDALAAFNSGRIAEAINLISLVRNLDAQFEDQVNKALQGIKSQIEKLNQSIL